MSFETMSFLVKFGGISFRDGSSDGGMTIFVIDFQPDSELV
jgi:hypothetical protein